MRVTLIVSLAAAALAAPVADPMPVPTAEAMPAPTAAPEPQGFTLGTPWGTASIGMNGAGIQAPQPTGYQLGPQQNPGWGGYQGQPQASSCTKWAPQCIYSDISSQVAGSISLAISSSVADIFGLGGTTPQPTGYPYQGQPYQGQPYQGQPYQGQPYQGQPYQGQPYQGQPYQGQPYNGQNGWKKE